MKLEVRRSCEDFQSFRAAKVKSLFNADSGATFNLDIDLPIEELGDWSLGVVVGPSGTGKTSIGTEIFGGQAAFYEPKWPKNKPIIDVIAPKGTLDEVTGALSAVGLGSVPSWLRPYSVLSMGEKFRADMARLVCENADRVVVDEFTSVVDRQIARIGSLAFAKAWKRTGRQVVLITPHYDVLEWLEPCWIFDTASMTFARGGLRRPRFDLEILKTDKSYWRHFEPHYYLNLPSMVGAHYYVGRVDGELCCHIGVATAIRAKHVECRASRLVVLPEWQGAGVGTRFLDEVAEIQRQGTPGARIPGRPMNTIFHTSHPALAGALRRSKKWAQVSQASVGAHKGNSKSTLKNRKTVKASTKSIGSGFGGHFRAIQGFRYYG